MKKDMYMLLNTFECCGITMATVIISNKATCVMTEQEYNRIIETERRFGKKDKLRVA